jgi:hypothetical protein
MQVGEHPHEQMLLAGLPQFGFVEDIDRAIRTSRLSLDSTQYEYLLALLDKPHRPMPNPGDPSPRPITVPGDPQLPGASRSSTHLGPPAAEVKEKVDAVLDVLPDFGRGFVEGCLQCSKWDTAATVDALLMGNVPTQLADCDRGITVNPLRGAAAGSSEAAKGTENGAAAGVGGHGGGLAWDQARRQPSAGALQLLHQRSTARTQKSSKYAGALFCCSGRESSLPVCRAGFGL